MNSKLDLYELHGEYKFIEEIIYEFNSLGFYTFTSQPGKSVKINETTCRKQRSYIRGYMSKKMSKFIINELLLNSNLFIRDEDHNIIIDGENECNCGSVIFINGVPGTIKFNVSEFDQSFNLGLPLRRPLKYCYYDLISIPPDLNFDDTTEFDIMSYEWETNDMWEILLFAIRKYHSIEK